MIEKKFYSELTQIKGIGIILVILGHSFSFSGFNIIENNSINNYIYNTIYSFHMPLFFIIAGFLSNNKKENLTLKFYISKIKRLFIPYIFINILDIAPRHIFNNLVNNKSNSLERVLLYSGAATWFIYTLFILYLIFPILERYILKKDKYYLFGMILFLLNLFNLGESIKLFTINRLIYMSFYFYIGYVFKNFENFYERLKLKTNESVLIIFILTFLIIGNNYKYNALTKLLFPFLGIISIWLFSLKVCNKNNKILRLINFLGENSLCFYILESFYAVIFRVILIKIIPLKFNFLLVSSFFSLKLLMLILTINYIISRKKLLSFLFGVKYKSQIR